MGKVRSLETPGEQVTQSFLGHIQILVFSLCEAFWEIFGQTWFALGKVPLATTKIINYLKKKTHTHTSIRTYVKTRDQEPETK